MLHLRLVRSTIFANEPRIIKTTFSSTSHRQGAHSICSKQNSFRKNLRNGSPLSTVPYNKGAAHEREK